MRCLCCNQELLPGEEVLCLTCLMQFPYIESDKEQNQLWKKLAGRFPFEHATSLIYYKRRQPSSELIRMAKFRARPALNAYLTELLLQRLEETPWPYDIDLIIPIPAHWRRILSRGYNQLIPIVETLSSHWHIPVEQNCLRRRIFTVSQLLARGSERYERQADSFQIRHPERLQGRHILLVDDVCTTGATLSACADLLLTLPGVRVSVLTLSITLHA